MKISNAILAAAVTGILAGAGQTYFQNAFSAEAGETAGASEKHDCKGMNSCKGKGCCAGEAGKNECKGKGGCGTPKH